MVISFPFPASDGYRNDIQDIRRHCAMHHQEKCSLNEGQSSQGTTESAIGDRLMLDITTGFFLQGNSNRTDSRARTMAVLHGQSSITRKVSIPRIDNDRVNRFQDVNRRVNGKFLALVEG